VQTPRSAAAIDVVEGESLQLLLLCAQQHHPISSSRYAFDQEALSWAQRRGLPY
jgi:hypothetical protein